MKNNRHQIDQKVIANKDLEKSLANWRNLGKKIVFTNGCFDLLHFGHLDYLARASELGDILIVAVNSDASVKKLKGASRPIKTQEERLLQLASLFFVDAVVLFEEDTPINLINKIEPHILVKGGDYQLAHIVGATETLQRGGEVKTIPFVDGYSSSSMIDKIKQSEG